jgi:hypothetical protein
MIWSFERCAGARPIQFPSCPETSQEWCDASSSRFSAPRRHGHSLCTHNGRCRSHMSGSPSSEARENQAGSRAKTRQSNTVLRRDDWINSPCSAADLVRREVDVIATAATPAAKAAQNATTTVPAGCMKAGRPPAFRKSTWGRLRRCIGY